MRNIKTIFLMSLILVILTACGAAVETTATPAAEPTTLPQPNTEPRATVTPLGETTDDASGYPAPPTTTPYPEGYVGPDQSPTVNPYPAKAGFVWMIQAAGIQCEGNMKYNNVEEAVAPLQEAGIAVESSMSMNLAVCEACSCPTSLHFRIQVAEDDVKAAEALGWGVEQ
ncbi:MAG: hypothetical protein R3E31_24040 [Chloroflexota bacterium]|nr:hypothetical protein [Ardenticatenaceae bacterium]MCB8989263.1 hypothetical protein [Ardenticatenaceae bacterium]